MAEISYAQGKQASRTACEARTQEQALKGTAIVTPGDRVRLTCMLVGQRDEAAGDVPPPVETHHLGLHVPVGCLEQQESYLINVSSQDGLPDRTGSPNPGPRTI